MSKVFSAIAHALASIRATRLELFHGYREWSGGALGDMPVDVGVRVDVIYRNKRKLRNVPAGEVYGDFLDASPYFWLNEGDSYDIVWWRPAQ